MVPSIAEPLTNETLYTVSYKRKPDYVNVSKREKSNFHHHFLEHSYLGSTTSLVKNLWMKILQALNLP